MTGTSSSTRTSSSAAAGAEVGELFRYDIQAPVSLKRRSSGMLPIVNQPAGGEKVSIYNRQVNEEHPLRGFQLVNTTNLYLGQGPITVFDGGEYAGDAQIADTAPGAKRLISYALDLDVDVAYEEGETPLQLVSARIVRGVVHVTRRRVRSKSYQVENSGDDVKRVLVEQPIDEQWELFSPKKPDEKTRSEYRFSVQAPAHAGQTLIIQDQQMKEEAAPLYEAEEGFADALLKAVEISPEVKAALSEWLERKRSLADIATRLDSLAVEDVTIGKQQSRIRDNMARLDRTSDLYRRYVEKLAAQEEQLDKIQQETARLRSEEATQKASLDRYLLELNVP